MPAVRPPVYVEQDLGAAGWRALHELATLRGRRPRHEILPLIQFALYRHLVGDDVELSRGQLEALFSDGVEAPAA